MLEARCSECGLDAPSVPRDRLGALIRDSARRWERTLAGLGGVNHIRVALTASDERITSAARRLEQGSRRR